MERYHRQILVLGEEGQRRIRNSSVLIVGVGGLGSASSLYLVSSGFGKVILVDNGRVELSNLNRQILYTTEDIGRPKVYVAAERLSSLNPEVEIEPVMEEASEDLIRELVKKVDIVVDGLDNWETRFLVNRVCVEKGKPFIHAGVRGMYGQLLTIVPGKGPCLQCLIPKPPKEETPIPVVSTTPGVLGLLQATEAIKLVTGYGEPSIGRLIIYDGVTTSFREIKVSRMKNCPVCSKR